MIVAIRSYRRGETFRKLVGGLTPVRLVAGNVLLAGRSLVWPKYLPILNQNIAEIFKKHENVFQKHENPNINLKMCSVVLAAPAGSTATTRTSSGTGLLASKLIISKKSTFSFFIFISKFQSNCSKSSHFA